MIAETALALAGPGARLVARPQGVAHVYTGPLTASGRFVPQSSRTVCRARTRRLRVVPPDERPPTLAPHAAACARRVCARCTACLARGAGRVRQVTRRAPVTRDRVKALYATATAADVAFALELATTPAEVDAAAWQSLLLFDVAGCHKPFTTRGRDYPPLHQLVCAARARVHGYPHDPLRTREVVDGHREAAMARRKADAAAVRADDARRVADVGFHAAHPIPSKRRRPRP